MSAISSGRNVRRSRVVTTASTPITCSLETSGTHTPLFAPVRSASSRLTCCEEPTS